MSPVTSRLVRSEQGLSLIELMIAIVIGSILILGVVQVFAASRSAYQLSQGIARNQENGRFAVDFLTRDMRMAGHTGCVNDQSLLTADALGNPTGGNVRSLFLSDADRDSNNVAGQDFRLRFDVSIQGFEANGTGPDSGITLPAVPVAGAAGDWTPALPAAVAGLTPVKGSDIVVLRYFSPEEATVLSFSPGSAPAISYPDEGAAGRSKVATGGHGLYAIADCQGATVFQASAAPGNAGMNVTKSGLNKTGLDFLGKYDGALGYKPGQASLFRAESMAYYVAISTVDGSAVPSLYRTRWTSAPGSSAITSQTEELVEGVESMQLLYGEDSALLTAIPSGYINKTNSAATIGDISNAARWRRVGAVQLGLLVRGGTERASSQKPDADPVVLGVTVATPADGHYRSVYETTVALRNRLFGN